jgi:hypothetical protein
MQSKVVGALVAVLASAGLLSPTATADGSVVLGGGAGIVVEGSNCTLTTIGRDHAGELVGFTAGHCGGPGAPVVAEGSESHGPVGAVAAVGDGLDYGVIKFEPAKVVPTASFAGFAINGIGPDPDWHAHACTNGAANGTQCGGIPSIPGPGPRGAMDHAVFQPGDDGGPVTSNDLLIGLACGGNTAPANRGIPQIDFTQWAKFSAIMNDVNAKGGPGAGFTPIPA